jgi:hypothetical protein
MASSQRLPISSAFPVRPALAARLRAINIRTGQLEFPNLTTPAGASQLHVDVMGPENAIRNPRRSLGVSHTA